MSCLKISIQPFLRYMKKSWKNQDFTLGTVFRKKVRSKITGKEIHQNFLSWKHAALWWCVGAIWGIWNLLIRSLITTIENIWLKIYLRFIWIQTYRIFFIFTEVVCQTPHFKSLVLDFWRQLQNSSLTGFSILFFYRCHGNIDFP